MCWWSCRAFRLNLMRIARNGGAIVLAPIISADYTHMCLHTRANAERNLRGHKLAVAPVMMMMRTSPRQEWPRDGYEYDDDDDCLPLG